MGTFNDIIEEEGVSGLWRGLGPSLILCVNPAITYGLHSRIKTTLNHKAGRDSDARLSSWETFLVGALAKTLATVVSYPYILAKVRLQWRPPRRMSSMNGSVSEKLNSSMTGSMNGSFRISNGNGSVTAASPDDKRTQRFLPMYKNTFDVIRQVSTSIQLVES